MGCGGVHRRQFQPETDDHQQDAPDAAIKVLERVYPLEAPVCPGQGFGDGIGVVGVAQAFFEIEAEVPDLHRNLEGRGWQVGADLDIGRPEAAGPFGKQVAGDPAVDVAYPLGADGNIFRVFLKQGGQAASDVLGEMFGDLAVWQRTVGGREFPCRF